jgi:hypothetical protein
VSLENGEALLPAVAGRDLGHSDQNLRGKQTNILLRSEVKHRQF